MRFFLGILVACCFSSCYEIRELVHINIDGSGRYELQLDFTHSKLELSRLTALTKEEAALLGVSRNPFSVLDSVFKEGAATLNSLPGIVGAVSTNDPLNFKYGITFEFYDVDILNSALTHLDSREFESPPVYYEYNLKGKFSKSRQQVFAHLMEVFPSQQEDLPDEVRQYFEQLYNSMTYKLILSTEGKIKRSVNDNAIVSVDRKQLLFTAFVRELQEEEVDWENTVKFKTKR
ncbi:hypothetical protein AAG747_10240 [Rapidithrix thailandica]|uniref:Lipoprotein n=1 Tax=Rapidithrix thailandica TaxID=413964 RepID=A0AAW9S410_9BACT